MKGLWKEICQDWADFSNNWKVMGASEGVPIEERMNAFFGQITFSCDTVFQYCGFLVSSTLFSSEI